MNEAATRTRWFLREWRKHFDLTLQRLADEMGTTKSYVSKLERKLAFNTYWLDRYSAALSHITGQRITTRDLERHPDLGHPSEAELVRAIQELKAALENR